MKRTSKTSRILFKIFVCLTCIGVAFIITTYNGNLSLDTSYETINIPTVTPSVETPSSTSTIEVNSSSHETCPPTSVPEKIHIDYIKLTDDEIYELATLVWLEARGESQECQKAVASVVINRMTTGNLSLHDVIYAKNQFTPANLISTSTPDDIQIAIVNEIVMNGPSIPEYVTYFRTGYYHQFSNRLIQYKCIDNTYFSYDIDLYDKLVEE